MTLEKTLIGLISIPCCLWVVFRIMANVALKALERDSVMYGYSDWRDDDV